VRPPDAVKGRPPGGNREGGPDACSANITAIRITQTPANSWSIDALPARLAERIVIDPESDCWVWTGRVDREGYGRLGDESAHVLVWRALHGPVPAGLELDHLCRVRSCVNAVAHLEPVTHRVNCLRGLSFAAVNAAKNACVNGHPFDLFSTYIRPNGHRDCRICTAARQRKYQKRRREEREQAGQRDLARAA
jgi:HNH endonuclease